jgi:transposase-like protein
MIEWATPADFKAEVLKMITNGQSVIYTAQALGISEALIYNRAGRQVETKNKRGRKTDNGWPGFRLIYRESID